MSRRRIHGCKLSRQIPEKGHRLQADWMAKKKFPNRRTQSGQCQDSKSNSAFSAFSCSQSGSRIRVIESAAEFRSVTLADRGVSATERTPRTEMLGRSRYETPVIFEPTLFCKSALA